MTMYGRNDTSRMAALSAEEERRRIEEEAQSGQRRAARFLETARADGWSSLLRTMIGRIRHALGRDRSPS